MLLVEDGAASAIAELEATGETWQAPLCRYHAMQYNTQRGSAKCALTDCHHRWAGEANGLRLCAHHLAGLAEPARSAASPAPETTGHLSQGRAATGAVSA